MAREGVTFEQVSAAADALVGAGKQPTIRAVREALGGTGSPNTIHRHLATWRTARPQVAAAAPELPASIVAEITREIERSASAARAEIEQRLVHAQSEAADLAAAGESLEAERDTLAEQVTALTTERDQAQATATERAAEIERQAREIERERKVAGEAQVQLAEARLKTESQAALIGDMRTEIERLKAELSACDRARQDAEQKAAVVASELRGAEKQLDTAVKRIAGQEAALAEVQARLSVAEKDAAGAKSAVDAEKRRADAADAERQRQFEAASALYARVDELTRTVIERTDRAADKK